MEQSGGRRKGKRKGRRKTRIICICSLVPEEISLESEVKLLFRKYEASAWFHLVDHGPAQERGRGPGARLPEKRVQPVLPQRKEGMMKRQKRERKRKKNEERLFNDDWGKVNTKLPMKASPDF
jgi:hypothetical protein